MAKPPRGSTSGKIGIARAAAPKALLSEVEAAAGPAAALVELARTCSSIADWMLDEASLDDRLAGSVPFCTMCAVAVAGWQSLLQARSAQEHGGKGGAGKTGDCLLFHWHGRSLSYRHGISREAGFLTPLRADFTAIGLIVGSTVPHMRQALKSS